MTDSVKRQTMANNKPFQDRCEYYFYEHARTVLEDATPDTTDLAFAKAIWAGQVKVLDMAKVVMTNATVGSKIDNDQKTNPEDTEMTNPITESDLAYVVSTENKFNALAESYLAAGLIEVA